MKKSGFIIIMLLAGLASCKNFAEEPVALEEKVPGEALFHAVAEEATPADTKVYVDETYHVLWNAGDQISLFDKTTINKKYGFTGADGDASGDFSLVPGEYGTGTAIGFNYAVYPYSASASYQSADVLGMDFPGRQTYRAGSVGAGANLMVAKSASYDLSFKNVGSYLCFRLYGNGLSVRDVILSGNNGEILSGPVQVTIGSGNIPALSFDDSDPSALGTSITLDASASPVALDASAQNYVTFWMVIPPVSFTKGFSVTVVDNAGKVYVKSTAKSLTFERGKLYVMREFDVKAGFVDFGIYPVSGESYIYNKVNDRMSIYEAVGNGWFRFLQIPTVKMLEVGPIPLAVAEGDTVDASLTSYLNGESQGDETAFSFSVQSFHNGILNLVSPAGDRFVIRF